MFKASGREPGEVPLPPQRVKMKKGILKGVSSGRITGALWVPVPLLKRKGWEMPFPPPKTSGGILNPLSELDVSPSIWLGKHLIHTWRNRKLAFCSGSGCEGGLAAPVLGTSSQYLWGPRVHEHLWDQMWAHQRKGWHFRPCPRGAIIKMNRVLVASAGGTYVYSLRDISSGSLMYMLYFSQNCFNKRMKKPHQRKVKSIAGFLWDAERVSKKLEENPSTTPKEFLVSGL